LISRSAQLRRRSWALAYLIRRPASLSGCRTTTLYNFAQRHYFQERRGDDDLQVIAQLKMRDVYWLQTGTAMPKGFPRKSAAV